MQGARVIPSMAWQNMSFSKCEIYGSQPFCYNTALNFEDTSLEGDRCFEFSKDVVGHVNNKIDSVMNPGSIRLECPGVGEIIHNDPDLDPSKTEFVISTL